MVLSLPVVDPIALRWGPIAVGWYSIAYLAALISIWAFARHLLGRDQLWGETPRPAPSSADYLIIYILFGAMIGGRLGYVLLKPGDFWQHPQDILAVWQGGNSLHFAGVGGCIATLIFARRIGYSSLTLADVCAPGVALGIFFGRIANFVRAEHWGRPSDAPWAVIFPGVDDVPRHPSQLYEAALEGLVVFAMLLFAARMGGLKRPGLLAGIFGVGHGMARIFCETFREPDPDIFQFSNGITVGMVLTVPMIVAGALAILFAVRRPAPAYGAAGSHAPARQR